MNETNEYKRYELLHNEMERTILPAGVHWWKSPEVAVPGVGVMMDAGQDIFPVYASDGSKSSSVMIYLERDSNEARFGLLVNPTESLSDVRQKISNALQELVDGRG